MPGYAANTAQNVAAGPTVAPVSLATDLAIATIFAVVGVTVYLLLRRIDRRAAGRRVVFAAVADGLDQAAHALGAAAEASLSEASQHATQAWHALAGTGGG